METPENTLTDAQHRALAHTVEASGLIYSAIQELAHLAAELAPLTHDSLEVLTPTDTAFLAATVALRAAHQARSAISDVASAFNTDEWLGVDADEPIALTLVEAR